MKGMRQDVIMAKQLVRKGIIIDNYTVQDFILLHSMFTITEKKNK